MRAWLWKRKPVEIDPRRAAVSAAVAEIRPLLLDGTIDDGEAAERYLAALYPSGEPVRGSFGDYDRSRGRCHHLAPYPGCRGGCR